MWFKNITLFQLTHPFRISAESLEAKLAERSARKCGPLEMSTIGWGSPLPDGNAHLLPVEGCLLIAARKSEKILPAMVVREALEERIAEIEANEARDVRNKEKQRLRDEITVELLPRAFSRTRTTHALIDPENGWLLIDTASRPRAEELTVLLRETLGSLDITNPETEASPAGAMSQWLFHGTPPAGFTLDDECEIRENDAPGGTIRCKNIDITQGAVRKHLEHQAQVVKLALSWSDRLSFVFDNEFTLRRIKPLEVIDNLREEHDEIDAEALFVADLILFQAEIREVIQRLFEALSKRA
jgi:recombination associated protein RdgC